MWPGAISFSSIDAKEKTTHLMKQKTTQELFLRIGNAEPGDLVLA